MWKVQSLIDRLNHQAWKHWLSGKWVVIDVQTISYMGCLGMKLQILYKREGDRFQCNPVCDEGYTYSFFFRHVDAPTVGPAYKHLDLFDMAKQVIWLAKQLANLWMCIYMDNLYNSEKLLTALMIAECLAHSVACPTGRGIPDGIKQAVELNAKKADALKGTTTAARLAHSEVCPNLLAVCVYDNKPVHLLSTVAESVEWIVIKRKVFQQELNQMKMMGYLQLNVIDD
jgi:hypothetical protein